MGSLAGHTAGLLAFAVMVISILTAGEFRSLALAIVSGMVLCTCWISLTIEDVITNSSKQEDDNGTR